MDIQGAEYAALLGMRNLLSKRKVKYLIIEYTPYLLVKYGINPSDLIELLEKYGFEIYEIDEDKYTINKVNIEEINKKYTVENHLYTNLLCILKNEKN